jgi:hypothetical protein
MIFGPDGKVVGVAAIIRDDTSRFNEQRMLRKRIAELEAHSN